MISCDCKKQVWKEKVAQALREKININCCRCGSLDFEVLEQHMLRCDDDLNRIVMKSPHVPCVLMACSNCGHIMMHSLRVLGVKALGE